MIYAFNIEKEHNTLKRHAILTLHHAPLSKQGCGNITPRLERAKCRGNLSLQDRRWKNQVELLNLTLGGDWPPACF